MGTEGSFGYKIGRKVRLMHVEYDSDMLWQTCVREIYVLMKHFGSINLLREAFEKLVNAKNTPKPEAIEKCKPYTDLASSVENKKNWYSLTRNCQHSFINILDSGYFLNNGENLRRVLLLDFNTNTIKFYRVEFGKESVYSKATIDEIMEFDDMPTKTYTEILTETKLRAKIYFENLGKVDNEILRLKKLIQKAKDMSATYDMIRQATELLSDVEWERKKLEKEYRYFYHRLDALNLLDNK